MAKIQVSVVTAAFVAALLAASAVRADCHPGHNMSVQSAPQTVVDSTPPPPPTADPGTTKTGG